VGLAAAGNARASIRKDTDIPAGGLGPALQTLAKTYHFQVLYRTEVVGDLRTAGAAGTMTAPEALTKVLSGTGLSFKYLDEDTITVFPAAATGASSSVQDSGRSTASQEPATAQKEGKAEPSTAFLLAQAAAGQNTGIASVENEAGVTQQPVLQEVLVTAQKRTENAQDVPAGLQVLSGDALEAQGVVQISDYMKQVAGLNVIGAGAPGLGEPTLRGITTGSDQSALVGMYLDDVPFTPSSPVALATGIAFDPDLADIDRIEVLEGPQSTLYGANTMGGLIKIVTREPDLSRWDGSGRIDASQVDGGGNGYGVRGTLNAPLIPGTMGVRATAFYRDDPGFVNNDFYGTKNVNWASVKGARAGLRIKFHDDLETTFSGLIQQINQPSPNLIFVNPDTLRPVSGLSFASPFEQPNSSRNVMLSNTLSWNAGFADVYNALSYVELAFKSDADYSLFASFPSPPLPAGDTAVFHNYTHSIRWTDELRLTSKPGRVEWLLGLFYTDETDYNDEVVAGASSAGVVYPPSSPYYLIYHVGAYPSFKEKAIFGDLTFHLTRSLEATLGIRYSANDQTVHWTAEGLISPATYDVPPYSGTDHSVTYLGTVAYKPHSDMTLYLRAASAYRPGGPNLLNETQIEGGALQYYKSDYLWNYEAGIKGNLWANRVDYTANVFHMVWTDIQQTESIDNFIVVANGAQAKSDGAQVSVGVKPSENLTVSVKAAYINGRFTADAPGLGAKDGDTLSYVPKTSVAALGDYRFGHVGAVVPTVGLTYAYHSPQWAEYNIPPPPASPYRYSMPSYETLDVRAGLEWSRYSFFARAVNVTNRYGLTNAFPTYALNTPVGATVVQPRTFGLSLSARF
jgi:outer membrane receptor protein involved in Fe transport